LIYEKYRVAAQSFTKKDEDMNLSLFGQVLQETLHQSMTSSIVQGILLERAPDFHFRSFLFEQGLFYFATGVMTYFSKNHTFEVFKKMDPRIQPIVCCATGFFALATLLPLVNRTFGTSLDWESSLKRGAASSALWIASKEPFDFKQSLEQIQSRLGSFKWINQVFV
jgi:hypothetical protein